MIITWFNTIVLALTSRERWGAASKLNSDATSMKWLWIIGGTILTLSIVSVLIATYKQKRKSSNRLMKQSG